MSTLSNSIGSLAGNAFRLFFGFRSDTVTAALQNEREEAATVQRKKEQQTEQEQLAQNGFQTLESLLPENDVAILDFNEDGTQRTSVFMDGVEIFSEQGNCCYSFTRALIIGPRENATLLNQTILDFDEPQNQAYAVSPDADLKERIEVHPIAWTPEHETQLCLAQRDFRACAKKVPILRVETAENPVGPGKLYKVVATVSPAP